MNIGAKILKKILVKQTQQHIKRITHHEQLIFVLDTTFASAFLPLIIQDLFFFVFSCDSFHYGRHKLKTPSQYKHILHNTIDVFLLNGV